MASASILSETLTSITSIKLDEIESQKRTYEKGKAELLARVSKESTESKKLEVLLDNVKDLAAMGKIEDNPLISIKNSRKILNQAKRDPSITDRLLVDLRSKLEKELDVHSLKYEYATLYGRLVTEWLSASGAESKTTPDEAASFETIGRKEMHEQRETWESYVFTARETNTREIKKNLEQLFTSTKAAKTAYKHLTVSTERFEKSLIVHSNHFDVNSLKGLIDGLLRSDLVSDEKSKVLRDFSANKVVLAEIADVLNMRISSLDKWQWDDRGTWVEQRRMLNGRYRFYHDEDLLQALLIRYIGIRWSMHFKQAFKRFQTHSEVWKSSSTPVSKGDRERRNYFLGPHHGSSLSVESRRATFFNNEVFLEQLTDSLDEVRGGYDDDKEYANETRKSGQQITQTTLHTLAAEILMKTRLGEDVSVVRSDLKWFGPSLPHATMFAVLSFFGVSDRWIGFFRRVLEAPMKFVEDGSDAPVQVRKRGTPISGPLSDMLGESVLFCLDFAFNQQTDGARLYRLHDDIWFWGSEQSCVKGWKTITDFITTMGLEINEEKTGSVKISRNGAVSKPHSGLPKGDVRWGFLKLDGATGRFIIDQENVEKHVEELRRQLDACKSVFDWIQAWNVYGVRFFTTNTGKPANAYGQAHINQLLDMFNFIQQSLFSETGGSVTTTLKSMITQRFGVEDIPDGYLYFSGDHGGLDLKSPFVSLYTLHNVDDKNPTSAIETFLEKEEKVYAAAKKLYEEGNVPGQSSLNYNITSKLKDSDFMSFEEYTRYREQTSSELYEAYNSLLLETPNHVVDLTAEVEGVVSNWYSLNNYQKWVVQLYAPEMIARFGGLTIVEKGLLPTGMVNMFRESRFKWQG